MNKNKAIRYLFIISIVIALYFSIRSMGEKLLLPFPAKVEYDVPSMASMTDTGEMLVIDQSDRRLIFSDPDGKVQHIEKLNVSSPIDVILQITTDGRFFYVRGKKLESDTSFDKSESILRYDANGKNQKVLYEIIRQVPDNYEVIEDICVYQERLYFSRFVLDENEYTPVMTVFSIDTDPETDDSPQMVLQSSVPYGFEFHYSPQTSHFYVSDFFGRLFSETEEGFVLKNRNGHPVKAYFPESEDTIIFSDPTTWEVFINDAKIDESSEVMNLSTCGNHVLFNDYITESIKRYDRLTGETETLYEAPYSPLFGLLTFLKFISVVYLISLLLMLIIRYFIGLFRRGETVTLKRIGLIAGGMAVIVLLSWFYTKNIIQIRLEDTKKEISIMSRYFSKTISPERITGFPETIDYSQNPGTDLTIEEQKALEFNEMFLPYIDLPEMQIMYPYVILYAHNNNRFREIYDSSWAEQIGQTFDADSNVFFRPESQDEIFTFSSQGYVALFNIRMIYDDNGEIVGAIEVGEEFTAIQKQITSEMIELTMELLTIFVAIFIVFVEGQAFINGMKARKTRLVQNAPNVEFPILRSLVFLFLLTDSFDLVILVLISKELLTAGNFPNESITFLMTLPSMACGFGYTFGTILYSFLSERIPRKKLMTFSVGIMAVCTILIIPVIIHKLFIPFCLLKFIKSVFINTIYALFMSIPYQITDESDRFEILRNNRIAVVSSGIFANLLGGFISQKFGTIALYAFNVIAFIPLIPAIIFLIPTNIGNGKVPDTIKNKIPMKTFGKFIFSIPMLAFFILLCLPLLITKSYYSFLFPIFMNAMDMPNMYITNLYVIAQTILLIISEPIKQITRNTDFWKLTILGMFIMGLAYLCFQLNSTILWIISVLIITSILGETVASFVDILWPRQAKVFGLDPESVNSLILILYNSIESIKEGIISIFLGFGNSEACIGIGGCCVVFTMLFALLSRKSALAKSSGQE